MIYSTAGVPDRASEWCERILQRLVAEAVGEPTQFVADSLQQIGADLLSDPCSVAVVTSRIVENKLCDALISSRRPVLVTLARPENAIKSLIVDYGVRFPDAVRRVACSICSLLPLLSYPNALVIDFPTTWTARVIAEKLIQHFRIQIRDDAIVRALAGLPAEPPAIEGDLATIVSAADRQDVVIRAGTAARYGFEAEPVTVDGVVKGAVWPVWAVAHGEALNAIAWHPILFLLGDADAKPPVAALDITGSSRCLVYGPYIALPKGAWTGCLTLKMGGEAAGTNLRIEIWADQMLKFVEFPLRSPGLIEVNLPFESRGAGSPLELRLFKTDSSSEGLLVFGTLTLRAGTTA